LLKSFVTVLENKIQEFDNIPFFFVIGRPRSGTTLLQTLFEAHPNVIIPPESPIIEECYDRFGKRKIASKKDLNVLIKFISGIRKFDYWGIDVKKLKNDLENNIDSLDFEPIIKIIYKNYISPFDKKEILIFGDKNPRYSRNPEKLLKIFPNARIIHVVRDYRDHILSMQKVKLLNSNLPLISTMWKRSQKKIFHLKSKLPEVIYSFRYEDFVKKPEQYFQNICEFLNIPFEKGVFDFHNLKQEYDKKFPNKTNSDFHSNLFRPINPNSIGKWKTDMNKQEVKKADLIVGKYAELSGYEREHRKYKLLNMLQLLPDFLYTYSYLLLIWIIVHSPVRMRKLLVGKFTNKVNRVN